jgi:hypothetical protein
MKLHWLLLFLFLSLSGITQDHTFPDGIYTDLDGLRNRYPTLESRLQVTRRSQGDIMMVGGNDYKLEGLTDSIGKKDIQKHVYAYVHGDSIFLNGSLHELPPHFCLCLTHGPFLVFKAGPATDAGAAAGVMFGAIGGAISATSRYLYVLSLRTGNVRLLTPEYVSNRLTENPQLLEQYNAERRPGSEETMIRYMDLFNRTLRLNPNVLTR